MAETRFAGRRAAPGLAEGPLVELADAVEDPGAAAGTREQERRRLLAAIARARAELAELAADDAALGAEILEFQIEMLGDEMLAEDALAAIAGGSAAAPAWRGALDPQIETYREAEDEYFAARASDLADLRDRVLIALQGGDAAPAELPAGAILLAADLTPSRFLALDWRRLGGAALRAGSRESHVAMLARARGVPLVVGLGAAPGPAAEAILDAEQGLLITSPSAATQHAWRQRLAAAREEAARAAELRDRPAVTAGGEVVVVMVNVDDPAAIDDRTLRASDGVGLLRTEFLFIGRARLPGEDEQYAVYRSLLERLGGRPAIIRTLDIGGDKPVPAIRLAPESNPFLGLRGLRLCLEQPELFRPQIRALLRAAVDRPLKIMLPMVTVAGELHEARALFADCLAALQRAGIAAAMPPLGIMVETPASAIAFDTLAADFYSIGSNDLTQYVMAAARDAGGRVEALADPLHPAVLRLIGRVIEHGRACGREISLCGEMASEPTALERLLALGLRRVSVAAAALGRVKLAVAEFGRGDG
jgi:phosphotransferase system enzyme I (PtsI)